MRNFIPAQRARTPSYSTAVANQGYLQNQADDIERKKRNAQMKAPIDMYNAYTNLTDHNPISDVLRKSNIGKNSASVQQAAKTKALENQLIQSQIDKVGGGGGSAAASAPTAATPAVNMAGGTAASTASQGGDKLAAAVAANNAATTGATTGAATAGKAASLGSKILPGVGAAIGAGANFADEKAKGSDDARVIGKTAGGAAPAALFAAAPALAAAGPVGWAGIAGLAALSLYGMIG